MAKERIEGDVLAEADFRITGKDSRGDAFADTVHAELCVSGAFQYGNGTCMVFRWGTGHVDSFDTRYDKVSPENFTGFAKEVLEGRLVKTVKVEVA